MLISAAYAQATAPTPPPGADFMSLLPLIAIFVVFYLLLIRPQAKRAKEQKLMIEALQKGDEVATAAGVLGRVGGAAATRPGDAASLMTVPGDGYGG